MIIKSNCTFLEVMMKKFSLIFMLFLISTISLCTDDKCCDTGNGSPKDEITLSDKLREVGSKHNLPTSGGDTIQGKVIDLDGDDYGDGMDLDGISSTSEIIYGTVNTGEKLAIKNENSGFPFYFAGSEIEYFFQNDSSTPGTFVLAITLTIDASDTNMVTLVISNGEILGIDTNSDGSYDEPVLSGIIPVFFSGYPAACLMELPAKSTTETSINVTVGGDGVTNYKFSLDEGEYSAEKEISESISVSELWVGSHILKVLGKNAEGTWQKETSPTVYSWEINSDSDIVITVTKADQENQNKISWAPAVELWAVTTLYETAGYESEKVKLTDQGDGTFTGAITPVDSNPRTIIIFDDVFTLPHPYEGEILMPGGFEFGSENHSLVSTDDFFSPCDGAYINAPGPPLADLVSMYNYYYTYTPPVKATVPTPYAVAPWLPPLGATDTLVAPTGETNDEVFVLETGKVIGNSINVDYLTFDKGQVGLFCSCDRGITYAQYSSGRLIGYFYMVFTDTNFIEVGGECGVRMPGYTPPDK
jgi:hypothetical protein